MVNTQGQEALDELYWKDEILQVMYWLAGENLANEVGSTQLADFLVADEATVAAEATRLVAEGYLECMPDQPPRYRLSELGRQEGGRSFHDEFAELMRRGHGECSPGCVCQSLGPEACASRTGHRH
jgi:hypothetical protein